MSEIARDSTLGQRIADFAIICRTHGVPGPRSPWGAALTADGCRHSRGSGRAHRCRRRPARHKDGKFAHLEAGIKSGFGGAEYLLAGMVSEGSRRGLSYQRIALLTATAPAERFGLGSDGAIKVGLDADLCLVDTGHTWTVRTEGSESAQEYTPFEGFELIAKVTDTFLRGTRITPDGVVGGEPTGRYLSGPAA